MFVLIIKIYLIKFLIVKENVALSKKKSNFVSSSSVLKVIDKNLKSTFSVSHPVYIYIYQRSLKITEQHEAFAITSISRAAESEKI